MDASEKASALIVPADVSGPITEGDINFITQASLAHRGVLAAQGKHPGLMAHRMFGGTFLAVLERPPYCWLVFDTFLGVHISVMGLTSLESRLGVADVCLDWLFDGYFVRLGEHDFVLPWQKGLGHWLHRLAESLGRKRLPRVKPAFQFSRVTIVQAG